MTKLQSVPGNSEATATNKPSLWDVPPIGAVLVRQPVLLEASPGGGRVGVVVPAELEVEEALVIGHHVDVHVNHLLGRGKIFSRTPFGIKLSTV